MVFLGSRGKFDQVTLVRLDPQRPTEDSTGQVEQNIFTGDLEASNVFTSNIGIANLYPTHNFELGSNLWMNVEGPTTMNVKKRALFEQALVSTQFSVNSTAPVFPFQVNDTGSRVFVDNAGDDLFNVEGNVVCENLIISQGISAEGDLTLTGNIVATKITIEEGLEFGSNIVIDDVGDPVLGITGNVDTTGDLSVVGNLYVNGNVYITDTSIYGRQENLSVTNAILEVGSGNDSGTFDTAVLFHQDPSNVFIGYFPGAGGDELKIGRTITGPADDNIDVLEDSNVDVRVYGNIYTYHNIGAGNVAPVHNLDVGANLWAHDTASNVLHVTGNVYMERATFGKGFRLGSNVVVDDAASNIFQVDGRAAFTTLFATERVGIANTNPVHTLCIGSNIHMHETGANLAVFHGNVVSHNIMTEHRLGIKVYDADEPLHVNGDVRLGGKSGVDANSDITIKSTGGIVMHADDYGSDNTNNSLTLKAGAVSANVSSVEVSSGATDKAKQFIKLKTKNAERVVINERGMVGIANTSPSANLTIGGSVQVVGSNVFDVGDVWSANKTTLRSVVDPANGFTNLQSRVPSGKAFNVHVSSSAAVGNPKMVILESGKVGMGTSTPQPHGLQVTGNVFVNSQVTARNNFYHESCPLTVTHPILANTADNMQPVIQLCRDATNLSSYGARAALAIGKHEITSSTSKTRMDINLCDGDYASANTIMTFLSSGLVGIGTHTPQSKLEVRSSGSANPQTNGILVYNPIDTDAQDAIVCMEVNDAGGDALTSYKVTTGATTGWSTGGSFSDNSKYKIANHAGDLNTNTRMVIDNVGNVGINVDTPSYKLHVDGDVGIGNKLVFKGVTAGADSSDQSFIQEKAYGTEGRTELVLFKTDNAAPSSGPDQIRHIAARHVFNVYNPSELPIDSDDIDDILEDAADIDSINYVSRPVLSVEKERRVLINSTEDDLAPDTRLYVEGNIKIVDNRFLDLGKMHILTETSSGRNIFKTLEQSDLSVRFGETGDFERVRFSNDGTNLINAGSSAVTPTNALHIYDDTADDVTLLNVQSPPGASASKYAAMQLTTDTGYGGFLRAQKGVSSNSVVLGYLNDGTHVDGLYVGEDGRVGVGTSKPHASIHVYDSNILVHNSTSDALVEFKTSGGTSNIYMNSIDNDLHMAPAGGNVVVEGSLTVQNDIAFGGRIEFGDAVGINIASPTANLHVNGGTIINSDQVSRKTYSTTFSVLDTEGKNIILTFGKGAFYAKITAILRYASDGRYMSTMVLEAQGGHTDNQTTSNIPIAIGTKNMFSGTNPFPWSDVVSVTPTTIQVVPYNTAPLGGLAQTAYYYDFFIELTTSRGGRLLNVKANTATKVSYSY
jgi:hypothetical protein